MFKSRKVKATASSRKRLRTNSDSESEPEALDSGKPTADEPLVSTTTKSKLNSKKLKPETHLVAKTVPDNNDSNNEPKSRLQAIADVTKEDTLTQEDRENTSKNKKFGPMRVAGAIKSTVTVDYQPDVCKDYKLTGYCGYGDSCKFLHMREDYAAGWKLDKEWETVQANKKSGSGASDTSNNSHKTESTTKDIPFKCVICKKDYVDPVETPCHHYFCSKCIMDYYRKKKSCYVCNRNTHGIVQPVKSFKELLAKQ